MSLKGGSDGRPKRDESLPHNFDVVGRRERAQESLQNDRGYSVSHEEFIDKNVPVKCSSTYDTRMRSQAMVKGQRTTKGKNSGHKTLVVSLNGARKSFDTQHEKRCESITMVADKSKNRRDATPPTLKPGAQLLDVGKWKPGSRDGETDDPELPGCTAEAAMDTRRQLKWDGDAKPTVKEWLKAVTNGSKLVDLIVFIEDPIVKWIENTPGRTYYGKIKVGTKGYDPKTGKFEVDLEFQKSELESGCAALDKPKYDAKDLVTATFMCRQRGGARATKPCQKINFLQREGTEEDCEVKRISWNTLVTAAGVENEWAGSKSRSEVLVVSHRVGTEWTQSITELFVHVPNAAADEMQGKGKNKNKKDLSHLLCSLNKRLKDSETAAQTREALTGKSTCDTRIVGIHGDTNLGIKDRALDGYEYLLPEDLSRKHGGKRQRQVTTQEDLGTSNNRGFAMRSLVATTPVTTNGVTWFYAVPSLGRVVGGKGVRSDHNHFTTHLYSGVNALPDGKRPMYGQGADAEDILPAKRKAL